MSHICLINPPGPSASSCGEHISTVKVLSQEKERALEKPKEETEISGAISEPATPISCVNVASGFSQKRSNTKYPHDHT